MEMGFADRDGAHTAVHQLRHGRVPKLVDLAFDLCLLTHLGSLIIRDRQRTDFDAHLGSDSLVKSIRISQRSGASGKFILYSRYLR